MIPSDKYFLTTPRLGFRCWAASDLPLANSLWGDPAVSRFIGGPFSEIEVKERFSRELSSMSTHEVQYWPLFIVATGDHVGCGGLRPYRLEEGIYELGIHLRPAYWGQGFAEEAGRAIITFAFETRQAHGLFAGHNPKNAASQKLLQKLGFQFTHDEFYPPTGLQHPSYLLKRPVSAAGQ